MKQARLVGLRTEKPAVTERTGPRPDPSPALSQRQQRIVRLYLTAILLLAMMFTVYIWQSTKMVEIKLRLKQQSRHIDMLETNNGVLRAEISKLQSIARIEAVARQELGMVQPQKTCYVPMPARFCRK